MIPVMPAVAATGERAEEEQPEIQIPLHSQNTNTYHQKIASLLPMVYAIQGQIAKHLPKIWRKKWALGGARLYNPQKNDPV